MVFWRAKNAKTAVAEPAPAAVEITVEDELTDAFGDPVAEISNVVTLPAGRLTERLAEAVAEPQPADIETTGGAVAVRRRHLEPERLEASALRAVLGAPFDGSHILLLGPPGTGRRDEALRTATALARAMKAPDDWVYAVSADTAGTLRPFAVPHGEGARLARDANAALAISAAMLERLIVSDDHRISLDSLEEDNRHRSDRVFDNLKRRAEGQNIALIKTMDGFALAPMHDGRVVRSDVFRALPEALQRDVEAKISGLETELQALVAAAPEIEMDAYHKVAALNRQVATRAVKPNIATLRAAYAGMDAATGPIDLLESQFIARASDAIRQNTRAPFNPGRMFYAVNAAPSPSQETPGGPAILARNVTPADLCGEIGHDATGAIALRSGHLLRANGGYLLIEAWRLATDPRNWAALSAALESRTVTPERAPGLAITTAPVPLSVKVVLIADAASWAKLETIDPGIGQHFPTTVAFEADRANA